MRRPLFVLLTTTLAAGASAVAIPACGDDDEPATEAPSTEATPAEEATPEPDPSEAHRERLGEMRTHLDLLALAHLADIDRGGLHIDLGTPARMKYTGGRWRNEWGTDGSADERTFTRLGTQGSLHFQVDEPGALTLQLELRKVGTSQVVLYLNGETLRTLDLEDGVQTHEVPVPAEHVRRGENELRLRATGTSEVDGEAVSLELDEVRVGRSGAASTVPAYGELVRDVKVGEEERRALAVPRGTTVTWYAQVPTSGELAFGVGSAGGEAPVKVRVRPAVGEARTLFEGDAGDGWTDRVLPLEGLEGQLVRLDFEAGGEGDALVAWSAPQVVVPLREMAEAAPSKSVVVLTIDTLRASKLKAYDPASRVQTPALDAFVEDAVLFENPQSPENWTKPSVASILTSLFPMTHNTKKDASSLPSEALTLGEIYKDAGFSTASFLANGYVSDRFGFNQGWDHYTNYIRENRSTEAENVFEEAAEWIAEHKDERFFVYIQTIDPHVPYDPPDEFLRMYDDDPDAYQGIVKNRMTGNLLGDAKRNPPRVTFDAADKARLEALHDGEISYHDRHFGRFVDKLRELGLWDEIVFVITSDHGEEFEEHGSWGHGHSVYQELLHVPLIVRWPGVTEGGTRIEPVVSTMDIGPTILTATGVEVPEVFEGRNLTPYLRGDQPPGPAVGFSDFLDDRRVIRAGRWKLILRGNLTWTMFDLEEDPGEQQQIDGPDANPVALRYLRVMLGQLLGASDRSDWLHGEGTEPARALPQTDSRIDAELCRQLRELGYVDSRCDAL